MNNYIGREQQKKGTIIRKSQVILFGEELPRGHGYKGKLSTKLSHLYDEITGRTSRKRQTKPATLPVLPALPVSSSLPAAKRIEKESNIGRPCIGIVGDHPTAVLVAKRLLMNKYTVVVMASEIFASIQNDQELKFKLQYEEETQRMDLQLIPLLPRFMQVVQVIFVMVGSLFIISKQLLPSFSFHDIIGRRPRNQHLFLSTQDRVVSLLKQTHLTL